MKKLIFIKIQGKYQINYFQQERRSIDEYNELELKSRQREFETLLSKVSAIQNQNKLIGDSIAFDTQQFENCINSKKDYKSKEELVFLAKIRNENILRKRNESVLDILLLDYARQVGKAPSNVNIQDSHKSDEVHKLDVLESIPRPRIIYILIIILALFVSYYAFKSIIRLLKHARNRRDGQSNKNS